MKFALSSTLSLKGRGSDKNNHFDPYQLAVN